MTMQGTICTKLGAQGDSAGAKQLYEQAIRAGRDQRDPEPRAFMIAQAALVFWHEGDYAGADAGFDLALRELPEYPAALDGKGRVALARGEYAAAIDWLRHAEAQSGSLETAWLLGDAYRLAGQKRAAERAYAKLTRDGAAHDPRTLAAFFAERNERVDEAVRLARAEYELRRDPYTQDVLALASYRQGQLSRARELSRSALAWGTRDAKLLLHAGMIERAAGDVARGQALIDRASALNPGLVALLRRATEEAGHASTVDPA